MITVNLRGLSITPTAVQFALAEVVKKYRMLPAVAAMPPAQECAWGMFCHSTTVNYNPESHRPRTIGGIPIETDLKLPAGTIQFRNADGVVLAEICNCAIPAPFNNL